MNEAAKIVAEYTGKVEDCERQLLAVRDPINHSLHKAMEIRHAILTYEMELAQAKEKFERQLKVIEENYSRVK